MKKLMALLLVAILSLGMLGIAAVAEDKEIIVAYMAKNVIDAFHATMNKKAAELLDGMVAEGLIDDWQLYDATTDPSKQVSLLEDAFSNGSNYVLLQPCEQAGSDPVVTRCVEMGVPIVVINSYTDSTMEKASGYSFSNDYDAGVMMAEFVKAQIPEGGKFAHMMGVVGSSAQILRGKGIMDLMNAESGWENVGDYPAEWLAEKAVGFTADVITQYGDELRAIVCDNDDMSSAVQAYCNSIGREDIVCIGVDGNEGPLTMVKEGTLRATVFQDGNGQVTYAIDTILRALITGKTEGVNMQNGNIPFILVTQENVDQFLKK
jgi:ABC-type sugar transport system substrate-binding protein